MYNTVTIRNRSMKARKAEKQMKRFITTIILTIVVMIGFIKVVEFGEEIKESLIIEETSERTNIQLVPVEYKVQSGDTLSEIAEEYYRNSGYYHSVNDFMNEIMRVNDIYSANEIQVGQILTLPCA